MQERYLGRLESGQAVCDHNGHKIGTIARVYRYQMAMVGAASAAPSPQEDIIEVKTGFLGLGHHYYVPISATEDVTEGGVILRVTLEEFDRQNWGDRPSYLDQLT